MQFYCCPHARGGGPRWDSLSTCERLLSPRTWGWTGEVHRHLGRDEVVPTHVGVDLERASPLPSRRCCPHARGGGPQTDYNDLVCMALSPRTWGWTCRMHANTLPDSVVPTHVGVDLPTMACSTSPNCCPHARGGGPRKRATLADESGLSPRTWGWTIGTGGISTGAHVVPTHVGVDRWGLDELSWGGGCPHARGGGPLSDEPQTRG